MRRSLGTESSFSIFSRESNSPMPLAEPLVEGSKPSTPGTAIRIAFCIVSWKLRPMAITSPTDFIAEPRPAETLRNLLRSHRGNLTTQ